MYFFMFLIILKSSFWKVMVSCSFTQNMVPCILLVNLLKIRASMFSNKNYVTLMIIASHFRVLLIGA